jgi:phospholipase C
MGVVWADQDFKSSGHFYNPSKGRGLYGNTNALTLANNYYAFALSHYNSGDIKRAMFFLGAAAHLVQDMTVPQHANIKLLQEHHRFEKFVRDTFYETPDYLAYDKGCYLESIDQFIRCNAIGAIKASHRHSVIFNDEKRYYEITRQMLPLAQRSTAGLFSMFYVDIQASDQIRANELYV